MAVSRETEDLARERIRHQHDHAPVRDLNREEERRQGRADRILGDVGRAIGTWIFVGAQALVALAWIVLNAVGVRHWDAYPFLLLNLIFSGEALGVTVFVLMALNRASFRDRLRAQQTYEQDAKVEEELKAIMTHLERQDELLLEALRRLDHGERELRRLQRELQPSGEIASE